MNYDVIVIGGGPSGLMASIATSREGAKVLLVDKGQKLGKKLAISGGGRCNVTNAKQIDELITYIPGNGRFLHSSLANFSNTDIMSFFENLGIKLKEEDMGRMFPVSDKAITVVNILLQQIKKQGVEFKVNAKVKRVLYQDGHTRGIELENGQTIYSRSVIIATGGKSVPHTGSTGDGYIWAEEAGHTITELYPTEVPITSDESFIKNKQLMGLSLRNITLTVWNEKRKKVIEHQGDFLFTHFGISGPSVLRCSQFVVKLLKKMNAKTGAKRNTKTVTMTIDLIPEKHADIIYNETRDLAKNDPNKALKNILKGYLPGRLIPLILIKAGLEEDLTYHHIPEKQWLHLAKIIKQFPIQVNGTLSIEEAFITGGGVHLKEIDPKTMQSKIMPGLFFCGEVIDVHGYTGGFNITAAFTTGFNAGMNAVQ